MCLIKFTKRNPEVIEALQWKDGENDKDLTRVFNKIFWARRYTDESGYIRSEVQDFKLDNRFYPYFISIDYYGNPVSVRIHDTDWVVKHPGDKSLECLKDEDFRRIYKEAE